MLSKTDKMLIIFAIGLGIVYALIEIALWGHLDTIESSIPKLWTGFGIYQISMGALFLFILLYLRLQQRTVEIRPLVIIAAFLVVILIEDFIAAIFVFPTTFLWSPEWVWHPLGAVQIINVYLPIVYFVIAAAILSLLLIQYKLLDK